VRYLVDRLLQMLPVLFLASVPVFLIIHLAEGNPVLMLLGVDATAETIEAMRQRLGLDHPLWQQYVDWIWGILRGDLGRSMMTNFTVQDLLIQRTPATFELAIVAIFMAIVMAFPLGVAAALRRGRLFDHCVTAFTSLAIAVPHFWLGILFVLFFAVEMGWLPAGGYASPFDAPGQFAELVFLPALTLSFYIAASITRFVRASMIEVLQQDYIRTAHSKGLPPHVVIYVHAARNALIPAITVLGVQFGRLLAGTIIVEAIFAWPGLGQLMLGAINTRDYPVVQGSFLVFVVLVIVSNLATDLLYSVIDPRIAIGLDTAR
jgi:peptide/nickel transport system permease protein